jgi:hypothetical protein
LPMSSLLQISPTLEHPFEDYTKLNSGVLLFFFNNSGVLLLFPWFWGAKLWFVQLTQSKDSFPWSQNEGCVFFLELCYMNISSSCPGRTTFIFLSLHGFWGRAKIIKKRKRLRAPTFESCRTT